MQIEINFDRPIPPIICEPADCKRLTGQNAAILARLRLGPATNAELAGLSLKYTSRVSDLRRAGYRVRCVRLDGGLTRYELGDAT